MGTRDHALVRALRAGAVLAVVLAGCAASAPVADAGPAPEGWKTVFSELPGTLLSAWESPEGVLYVVGGGPQGPLVLCFDSGRWSTMDPGTSRTLWWVTGFSARDVTAVGEHGVVTHFDGTRWTVLREGGDETFYGAWGPNRFDVTAVGGVATSFPESGALANSQTGWVTSPSSFLPADVPLFKVWGTPQGQLFVVGENGLLAEGTPGAWQVQQTGVTERLTTVHGAGNVVYAVGGLRAPIALRRTAAGWVPLSIPGAPALLDGVAVNAQADAIMVGLDGYLAESFDGGAFTQHAPLTSRGLHGALATRGGFVAVGGELTGRFGHGVLLARDARYREGPLQPWAYAGVPFDAGVDGGPVEPPDGGWLPPGAECESAPAACDPTLGLRCWFVFGPYRYWCGGDCSDVSECGAYGAGACCKVPGPQVSQAVCLPADACDAG